LTDLGNSAKVAGINAMSYILTEHDIRMFLQEPPKASWLRYALPSVAVLATVAALVVAVTSIATSATIAEQNPVVAPSTSFQPPVADAAVVPEATPTPKPTPTPLPVTLPNDTFSAADLKISAPIIWEVPFNDKDMNKALEKGVIHVAGTPLPGQQGMTTIAGHSSNFAWAKGQFNQIFAPLTKATPGQTFEINYQGVMYRYEVTRVYEVKPNRVDIMSDHSQTGARFITCTPIGTSLRRLIVDAKQVFPDPTYSAPFTGNAFNGTLPSN
jgi:LPXTG-site transpeptidase (sortase) family protein